MQTRLGSLVAVALVQARGYGSDWTLGLGTSICPGSSPRKGKKTKKKKVTGKKINQGLTSAVPGLLRHLSAFFVNLLVTSPNP